MILFIQHIDIEGPETIGAYFQDKGYTIKEAHLYKGEELPSSFDDVQAVVSLGGPMNVYDEETCPYLVEENAFLKKALNEEIPFLGICLGSQLLTKAAEGKVVRSPKEEIGFMDIQLTDEGRKDPLFKGLDKVLHVYQWHGDMSQIPPASTLLAFSENCPIQAFRIGKNAYGLQFHIEITDRSIREWSDRYYTDKEKREKSKSKMLADYAIVKDDFNLIAEKVYQNFLNILCC